MFAPIESRYNYDLVSGILRSANAVPHFVQYAREIHTMLALVGAGIGIALVPESAETLNFSGVVLRRIAVGAKSASEFTLVWRKHADNPALKVFVEAVTKGFVGRGSMQT